jgi:hypothetical protein
VSTGLDLTEAVEAAAKSCYYEQAAAPDWNEAAPLVKLGYRQLVLPYVTAAAPIIERQVRERIARGES